jgi:DNA-binding protein HU-beta
MIPQSPESEICLPEKICRHFRRLDDSSYERGGGLTTEIAPGQRAGSPRQSCPLELRRGKVRFQHFLKRKIAGFSQKSEILILLFPNSGKICTISPVGNSVTSSLASEDTRLIKQDIVHQVIERTGLPRTKAEAAVDTVFEGLKQALAAGERIELRGFGVFSVRARKTGIGRNPRTGTEVSITPGKAVRFKPGKELHSLETGSTPRA